MRRLAVCVALLALVPAGAAAADWPTFHGDNTRQGDDAGDPGLASPAVAWTSTQLDGTVYGQPLIAGNQVIVATENNTVYSLSAASGVVQWSTHVGTPRTTITCGNINPLGITGTPVIDNGSVFAVADIQASSSSFFFELVSLNLTTGAINFTQNIDPPDPQWSTVDPWEQERGALLATGGRIFVPLGGLDGDCGSYHGYVLSFPESGSGSVTWWASTQVDSSDNEGGIWAAGGLSQDASGSIYAATGNSNHGSASDAYDYSDGVIKLDPTALAPGAPLDYFAPSTWYQDNAGDQDLGSTAPMQLPNNRAFIAGKTGIGYLLSTVSLGHVGGQLAAHQVCNATGDAAFGTLAYANGVVFVGCSDGVAAVQVASGGGDFSALWYNTTSVADHPPTVAGGIVWSVSSGGNHLLGFSAATGQLLQNLAISGSTHFTTPSAANDQLYVGAGRFVDAFTGAPPPVASRYHPLPPYRVLDTRASSCMQCGPGALGSAAQRAVNVAGYTPAGFAGTIVPASASAVVLNLTAVNGSSGTFLTAFPTGQGVPVASSVNAPASRIIANLVTVPVGASGQVSVYNSVGVINVLLDVEGYYDTSTGNGGTLHALTPLRVCDTRAGTGTACSAGSDNPLHPGEARLVSVWGHGGIPGDGTAAAAVLNLTAVSGSAPTYLSAYPPDASTHTCGTPPGTSNINVPAGTDEPNRVIVPIDPTSGSICVFNAAGTINVVVDANGWFGTGTESALGAHFFAVAPTRVCDTRTGQGTACAGHTLGPAATLLVQATGVDGIPASGVQAVAANATAVLGTAGTFVTLYPDGVSRPPTSDLNAPPGLTIANMVIGGVSSAGRLDAFNDVGNIDVVLDIAGWFA